jgi:hypothetical protein
VSAAKPFEIQPTTKSSFLQRLRGRKPIENAIVEVNNLLARVDRVRSVSPEQLAAIAHSYDVDLTARFADGLEKLYRDYLVFCLSDRRLTDEEVADLAHLQEILGLTSECVDTIHRRVARDVYFRTIDEVVADGAVDERERLFLVQLRAHLSIPDEMAENMLEMKLRRRTRPDGAGRRTPPGAARKPR